MRRGSDISIRRRATVATGVVASLLAAGSVAWACAPLISEGKAAFIYEFAPDAGSTSPSAGAGVSELPPVTPVNSAGAVTVAVEGYLALPFNEGPPALGNTNLYLGKTPATSADNVGGMSNKCYPADADIIGNNMVVTHILTPLLTTNRYTITGTGTIAPLLFASGVRTVPQTYMMCAGARLDYWKALVSFI